MKKAYKFLFAIIESRKIIWELTARNLSSKYKKSKFGFFWAFAEPLAFMFILNLVFGIGLRGGAKMDIPFILYLITGLSVVQFFQQYFK